MSKNPLSEVFGIFNKLAPQQKILMGAVTVIALILLGFLFTVLNQPSYSVLFSNLTEEDASKVVEHLNSQKILFNLKNNGHTIEVQEDKVYETRLQLAGKGIPSSGIVGYEIFDKTTMGMSEFMQKLNFKRAIEGELARTISQQEGITGARVHIVVPQRSLFRNEEKEASASIVLKMKNGFELPKENINAIINLVASSVEGLSRNKVTLIDTQGNLLSKESDDNDMGFTTSRQYEIKQNVEKYLATKAQTILDNVLGYGNALVQVNADLDFDQVEKQMETFDPESQVAVSEQVLKNSNNGINMTDSTAQLSQNSTTNYEISKTIEKVVAGIGNVKRLTVATVINDSKKEIKKGDKTEFVFEPRPQEQLKKLETLIQNAVGINTDRGDQFSIVNIPFEENQNDNLSGEDAVTTGGFDFDNMQKYLNMALVVFAIIISLFLLKSLMNKLKNEKIMIGTVNPSDGTWSFEPQQTSLDSGTPTLNLPKKKRQLPQLGNLEDEISDEALRKQSQQEKIANYVQKNPIEAAKLINSWLHEDEYK